MTHRQIALGSLIVLAMAIAVATLYPFTPTDSDMAYIVKDSLRVAIVDRGITDIGVVADYGPNTPIILSTAYLHPEWVPAYVGEHRIVVMKPEEIQAKADANGTDIWCLHYSGLKVSGGNYVKFELSFYPILVTGSTRGVLSGGRLLMAYTRVQGIWEGRVTRHFT